MKPNQSSRCAATVLFLVLLLSAVTTWGARLQDQVSESRLSNGMKVILLENRKAPIVTFQVWYWAGSRNEVWGKTGLSHLLEHMMFKGTETVSAEEFIRTIQENGGTYNAFTSHDFAGYFETLSADRVQVSIDLESDRMQNLVFREEDFRTERMVVMEERRMRVDDNPQAFLMEQLDATAFQTQPYHWPIIGWMDDLARIGLEDAVRYYRARYHPGNAFIVVVGDMNKEDLLPKIEAAFGAIPKGPEPERIRYRDPPQLGERRVVVEKEAQLPAILMGYHAPNLREPDSYVLEVIEAVLSEGKSSRFYESLVRRQGLALEASARHSLVSMDPSLFYISAVPLPGKDIAEVEKALDEEIERLKNEPIPERELQKAKNQLEAAFVFSQDSVFTQAMLLARYEIAENWRAIDDYIPAIRAVTAEDIQRVASRIFVPTNRTVGILKPLPPSGPELPPAGGSPLDKVIE